MTALEAMAVAMRLAGLVCLAPGLFLVASGVRTVVSGLIDERARSARSLRLGLPLLLTGVVLLFGGTWLANWARQ
jgi:hypothetical protein